MTFVSPNHFPDPEHAVRSLTLQRRADQLITCLTNHGVSAGTARAFTSCFERAVIGSQGSSSLTLPSCVSYSTRVTHPHLTKEAAQSFRLQLSTALAKCTREVENIRSMAI